jgi:hypothetical protein
MPASTTGRPALGHAGSDQVLMQITGVDDKTIRRGREELAAFTARLAPDDLSKKRC